MAERLRKMHQDDVRSKIQTSQLINRLQDHALGKITLETSQIKAIEVLIRKTLPDLSQVTAEITPAEDSGESREAARAEVREIFGKPYLAVNNGQ
jgi:hypothetical protein